MRPDSRLHSRAVGAPGGNAVGRASGASGNPGDDVVPPAKGGWRVPLYKRFRSRRKPVLRIWWPWLLLALVLLAAGWLLVKPAPPNRLVIAAGPRDGAYYAFAQQYAQNFARDRVQLDVRETAGTVENYRLFDTDPAVTVAIVQGGAAPPGVRTELRSIASLYLEPVWVFHRLPQGVQLGDFRGKRLAVGPEG